MYDTLVKAWAHWGDYLENLFTKERSDVLDLLSQQLSFCVFLLFCDSVCVSGARCRLFAYGPADATASQNMSFSVTFFRRCRGTVPSVLALTLLVGRLEEHPACKS